MVAATPELTLRKATRSDVADIAQICYDAFCDISCQHSFLPDFPSPKVAEGLMEMIVDLPGVWSVVAEHEGRVVGSNFLWESDTIAGVGPITVAPRAQGDSVGKLMMREVLRRADELGKTGVRLVQAGYNMRSMCLYSKLGFDVKEPLACINGIPLKRATEGYDVRMASPEDLRNMDAVCSEVHGHTRTHEVSAAIAQGAASVVERDGVIVGYTTGIGFFGHSVAVETEALKALIAAAPSINGPGMLLPIRQSELFRWCLAEGFRMTQPMTLMARGWYQEPRGVFLPSILL